MKYISELLIIICAGYLTVCNVLLLIKNKKLMKKNRQKDGLIKELKEWIEKASEHFTTFCKHFEIPVPVDFDWSGIYSKFFAFKTLAGQAERLQKELKELQEGAKSDRENRDRFYQEAEALRKEKKVMKTDRDKFGNECLSLRKELDLMQNKLKFGGKLNDTLLNSIKLLTAEQFRLLSERKHLLWRCRSKIYRMKKKLTSKG